MILRPALSALLATGLAVPEKPTLVLSTPAIVRAQSIEFSKHMLLGMPVTMGMFGERKSSAISYINSVAQWPADSLGVPAHQVGDLIVIVAWNSDGSSAPTVPAGFVTARSQSTTPWAFSIGYRIATTTTTTSGTWANATSLAIAVYRGAIAVGAATGRTGGNTSTLTWDSLTLTNNNWGTSWVAGLASVFNTASGTPNAPSGRTLRLNSNYSRWWDTNGAFTGNYASQSASMNSQSYASAVIEIVSR